MVTGKKCPASGMVKYAVKSVVVFRGFAFSARAKRYEAFVLAVDAFPR